MKTMATRANPAQVRQHIKRQRAGISGMEFAQRHPVLDAIGGALVLVAGFGGAFAALMAKGAGLW